jgi:hypothetical protein
MQVVLGDDPAMGGFLLFGDHKYPMLRKIVDVSAAAGNEDNLRWRVLLSPHHCSKSAMYQDEDGKTVLKQDILDDLEALQVGAGYIVASSNPIPASNEDGDNPPHALAKKRYEEIAAGAFVCTHDDGGHAEPLRFTVNGSDIDYDEAARSLSKSASGLAAGVSAARGSNATPSSKVGFGWSS